MTYTTSKKKVPCPPCYGRGWNAAANGKQKCRECGGTGRLGAQRAYKES